MKTNAVQTKTVSALQQQFKKALGPRSKFHLTIPSFKTSPKNRNELIMELGGTHLKLYQLNSRGQVQKIKQLDFYHNITYTPDLLNKQLLHHLQQFLSPEDFKSLRRIFFIFAYPLEHFWRNGPLKGVSVLDGKCLKFSKSHQSKGIIGSKVGQNLEKFLEKKTGLKIEIITFNDSLSTVFGNFVGSSDTLNLGIIAGTGTNCGLAYLKNREIQFFNTEFGTFSIPLWSEIDKELVKKTGNEYLVEKMISGNWQHQLFKIAMNWLIEAGHLPLPDNFDQLQNWDSAQLEKYFSKLKSNDETLETLQGLWYSLSERGAKFLALTIGVLIKNFKFKKVNLTLTGAVFEYTKNFQKEFLFELKKQLPKITIKSKFIDNTTPSAVKNLFF